MFTQLPTSDVKRTLKTIDRPQKVGPLKISKMSESKKKKRFLVRMFFHD